MIIIVIQITLIITNKENLHLYYWNLCLCAYDNNKILCTSYSILFIFFLHIIILFYHIIIIYCSVFMCSD